MAERGGALETHEAQRRQHQSECDAPRRDAPEFELGWIDQRAPAQHHDCRQSHDRRERADLESEHEGGGEADVAAGADAGDADADELPDHGQAPGERPEEHVHEVREAAGDGHGGEQVGQTDRPRRNHPDPRSEPLDDDVGERPRRGGSPREHVDRLADEKHRHGGHQIGEPRAGPRTRVHEPDRECRPNRRGDRGDRLREDVDERKAVGPQTGFGGVPRGRARARHGRHPLSVDVIEPG